MHFVSVLDNHPLSEKAKAMFGEAKSEKSGCETSVKFYVTFQVEL